MLPPPSGLMVPFLLGCFAVAIAVGLWFAWSAPVRGEWPGGERDPLRAAEDRLDWDENHAEHHKEVHKALEANSPAAVPCACRGCCRHVRLQGSLCSTHWLCLPRTMRADLNELTAAVQRMMDAGEMSEALYIAGQKLDELYHRAIKCASQHAAHAWQN